jgi:small-conductance mechanosensitive channel
MKTARIISIVVLAGMLAGALALAFPGAVLAQDPNPPSPTTPAGQASPARQAERIEQAYQRALKALDAQAKRLAGAGDRVQKLAEHIAGLKSQGKDTTALEEALAEFKTVLKDAHTTHDTAASMLKTHPGFDANGKVTDLQQARETVRASDQLLSEVHRDLRPSIRDLLRAVREYLRDNRGK